MDISTTTLIDVLAYLLPGFVTSALIYNLTPAPRHLPFERIVEALIFTIFVQVLMMPVRYASLWVGSKVMSFGVWTSDSQLAWSLVVAIALGLVWSYMINSDRLHKVLRKRSITLQTSYPSEWFGAFAQHKGYVVLHLQGERRLYGWAHEWPSAPDRGHFVVLWAKWLDEGLVIPLKGVDKIIVRAKDVEMVELLELQKLEESEATNG